MIHNLTFYMLLHLEALDSFAKRNGLLSLLLQENVRKQRSRQARAFEPNPSTPPASSPPDSPPRERQPRIINLEHSNLLISSLDGSESPTTAINRLYREAGVELDPSDAREHEEELAWQDADSMHGQVIYSS